MQGSYGRIQGLAPSFCDDLKYEPLLSYRARVSEYRVILKEDKALMSEYGTLCSEDRAFLTNAQLL